MSVFLYNNHSVTPPSGSIIQYMGTSDPDGWVICDGQIRTFSDNRYADLILVLGSSYGDSNNFTPPNLKSYFLCGSALTSEVGATTGPPSITLSTANMPAHTHTMDHQHYYQMNAGIPNDQGGAYNYAPQSAYDSGPYAIYTSPPTNPDTGSAGSGTSISIPPPQSFLINYIIKY